MISTADTHAAARVVPSAISGSERTKPGWRQLRLAYLTTQYPKVSHTFIRRELRELEARGHYVLRLAIRPADSAIVDPADLEEARRTLHCLARPRRQLLAAFLRGIGRHPVRVARAARMAFRMGRRTERGLPRHFAYLVEAVYLLRELQRHRIEHVHVHFGTNAAAVARLIRCLGGPPYSFTVHGPDEFDAPRAWRLGDKQADAAFVVAITSYCSAQLRRWAAPEHWPRIHVLRCGVSENFLEGYAPIPPDSRTFVCVGRLCPQKGQLVLLEAAARLRDEGLSFRIVLAGDGEMRPAIERRIAELGLESIVHITGWIGEAQVREQVLAGRAMVLPSFAEGLPVVIMEAMALGRPVISTYVAGIPELVRPGETGWLVPAGSVEELAEALREALLAPVEQLDRLGRNGRRRVMRNHRASVEAGRLEELILASRQSNGRQNE
ncbi:MAG TPA: glycosyltransferase [Phycisphaerae bacterium]|nr:glycosyltransferase [Phycisphaerae bacterium]HOJ74441.1 glycosyltransferase [Phycisphaerae bacterium]HOM52930.1 glycosyltransferase [Phycisphaerae bacterium]HON66489.1 glycosyltransferase [Phycisphaerae bacterium]HPP27086.1 glycosyltransferase [Phycisphaerae bacterium]